MRVLFYGTPDFAVPTLDALVATGHAVVAVVAQPDRPKGRGLEPQPPPTVVRARAVGLPVLQPTRLKSGEFPAWVAATPVDVAVVVAYGRILPPTLLQAPLHGCLNVHASLLPRYRGAAPIQWAVIRGERETGCVTMRMDEGLDTGPLLLERRTQVGSEETAADLFVRLAPLGAELLIETLARLDTLVPRPQDASLATLAPPLRKEDGHMDWSRPAQALHDLVRGVQPWPGAATTFRGEPLKVHRTRVVGGAPTGTVGAFVGPGLVQTGEGALELVEVQLPGKRRQSGAELMNGRRVSLGEVLG